MSGKRRAGRSKRGDTPPPIEVLESAPEGGARPTRRSRREAAASAREQTGGWRSTRRSTRSGKKTRREIKIDVLRERVTHAADRTQRGVKTVAWLTAWIVGGTAALIVFLLVLALSINGIARWNARRVAQHANSPEARLERAKDNLLVIGLDAKGNAAGFLVLRVNGDEQAVYGIAVPDGAFIEVPGQGFERIGDSWIVGADVSLDAVSNFFAVPFEWYVSVDQQIYQTALKNQTMAGVLDQVKDTNLSEDDRERFADAFDLIPSEKVALVPMPVKPMNLGDQTYLEPQRNEIADLVKTWWNVDIGAEAHITRVIVYNGAGIPGIAGEAAQQLIRAGYRVVDTKNADTFAYATTQIIVQNGGVAAAEGVVETLGVGTVSQQPADQEIADLIVIIGKDYKPPAP